VSSRSRPSPAERVIQTIEMLDQVDARRMSKPGRRAASEAAGQAAENLLETLKDVEWDLYERGVAFDLSIPPTENLDGSENDDGHIHPDEFVFKLSEMLTDFLWVNEAVIDKLDARKYPQARGQRTTILHSVLMRLFHKAGLTDPKVYRPTINTMNIAVGEQYAGNFARFTYDLASEIESMGGEFNPNPILRRHIDNPTPG